ncbi:acetyltransferase, GNAT family [Gottschalkia acidurici 9a]|uniref:Acetyltransferase, GNAT family n=1 Tax=Gottschalkia acidurici (strain ATCC 7906 / DSM 604 / BCRC 14475 / CIP 104303 / KCTC 5404 / NCIMB 10678 / 9a) TaxID=1128398 RepID=K0AYY1_GOTA9|nr:GNAT family N-acetyltransferase [Gottschalkia acidurici]AFS78464.1 acetyltransferase, GNAT family [Gottschalkia acidurici 9a]
MDLVNVGTETIETDRLVLRRFTLEDANDMLKNWISDKEVQLNYGEPVYESDESVKKLLEGWIELYSNNQYYRWAIILKENSENIGQIAFCHIDLNHRFADIEYCISRSYQRKGYSSEALNAIIEFTFEKTGLNRLQAFHRGRNIASGKVLKKSKMKCEGVLKQTIFYEDEKEYDDKIYYGIIKSDYHNI